MSKVRNSKASDPANSQKSGGHHQENNKSSNHTVPADATAKSGMQMESQESEVKQIVLPTKEIKSMKSATKTSKRIAEANEKKESQMNAENGVHKSKSNKKTENGDHSDKKSDKLDFNNGITEGTSKDDSEGDIKLVIEDEVQVVENVKDKEAQPKANGNSQEKEGPILLNKSVEKDKELEIQIEENQLNETKDELANGDQSISEQSFQNLSFGRTLRKIAGRPSLGRLGDRHESMNSSMFVNTSFQSTLNDDYLESKYSHIRSSLKRKASNDIDSDPNFKRVKSEPESAGYSFFPIRYFSSFRRSDETVEIKKNVIENNSDVPPETSKSKCLIM